MIEHLVPTSVVGSYPQPDWLVDRELLATTVPRVRMPAIWRVPSEHLEEAQDAATLAALSDMTRAGIDIVTDGEIRRESYSNHLVTKLDGIDCNSPATIVNRRGNSVEVPRVVGPIRRTESVERRDAEFLRRNAAGAIKVTVPGPFTLAQQAKDEYYRDPEALAMAFADVVNEELLDVEAAGADVVQLDEPWLRNDPDAARRFGVQAIDRALEGVRAATAVHLCFGYAAIVGADKPAAYAFLSGLADSRVDQISIEAAQPDVDVGVLRDLAGKTIILGVIDLGRVDVETPEEVADRIRRGLRYVTAERLVAAPDCGMKYLPRERAYGKLEALAKGAAIVRGELAR
jgi:5-methyltetrahydropteroyltriglutamate--homocysteine methyltransferase